VKKLVLVRHGETDYNRQHRLQGQLDIPLNDIGIAQAKRVSLALRSDAFDAIWSSPLSRSVDTAIHINRFHDAPLHRLELMRERSFGQLEGQPQQALKDLQNESTQTFAQISAPGGESLFELSQRAQNLQTKLHGFSGERLLLVGHAGLFRALIGVLLNWDIERWSSISQHNTCINSFMLNKDWEVSAYQLNEVEHHSL
jgi:broad specificity phosphatase PhoE